MKCETLVCWLLHQSVNLIREDDNMSESQQKRLIYLRRSIWRIRRWKVMWTVQDSAGCWWIKSELILHHLSSLNRKSTWQECSSQTENTCVDTETHKFSILKLSSFQAASLLLNLFIFDSPRSIYSKSKNGKQDSTMWPHRRHPKRCEWTFWRWTYSAYLHFLTYLKCWSGKL